MTKLKPNPLPDRREHGRVYMGELAVLINRQPNTIRIWDREGILPDHLRPKRGKQGWRYWTDKQVYGNKGIIAWMAENDMRPGNYFTDPDNEEQTEQHLKNLRKPRLLTKGQLLDVEKMIRSGYSRGEILTALYPRTNYSKIDGLEAALVKYYNERDMYFPPKERKKLSPEAKKEVAALEKTIKRRLQGAIK